MNQRKKQFNSKSHTFVVCAYRESPFLEECICSLMRQSVKTNICIATSTPNAYIHQIAEKYQLPLYINTGETGIAGDWNFACSCARTSLVTLAHQDDVYEREYAKKVLEGVNLCEHPLIVFTDYTELRNGKTVNKSRLLLVKRLLLTPLRFKAMWNKCFVRRRVLSMGSAICCPSVTMVKENIQWPLFRNNMKSNIDWQAWEELSRLNGEFAYISEPLMQHRIHEQSTTSELLEVNGRKEEDLYMFRKFWPKWVANVIGWVYQINEKANKVS